VADERRAVQSLVGGLTPAARAYVKGPALSGRLSDAGAVPKTPLRGPVVVPAAGVIETGAAPASGPTIRDLSPAPVTLSEVSALLEGECDLLHFAGHGQYFRADPYRSVLLLDDGELRAGDIVGPAREGAIHRNRPLVFFNACEVGRVGYGLTGVGGWAEAFVGPGCGAFVAPLWKVEDRLAAAFATVFYEGIRGDDSLGEALVAARRACQLYAPDNPTWLAYMLYGHPAAQVRFGE